jgi:hypothetical protein
VSGEELDEAQLASCERVMRVFERAIGPAQRATLDQPALIGSA